MNIHTKTLATQTQINAIIGSAFVFQFGFEQISGGSSGSETMAVDQFTIAPESGSATLVALALGAAISRRRRSN